MTVIYRVDACVFGLLAAWVKHFFPNVFSRGRFVVFLVGLIVCGYAIYFNAHLMHSIFYRRAAFIGTSLGASLLLPLLDSWRAVPIWGSAVGRLSLWAYALYLGNLPVYRLIRHFSPFESPIGNILLFLFASVLVAEFVFTFYEKPLMDLLDRWAFRRQAPAVSPGQSVKA